MVSGSASSVTTGKKTSPRRRTPGGPWTPRSTCCAGWAPSWRSAACGRSASYFDVKIIIAESEIFSVHQKNLIARFKDFGCRLPLARAAVRALHRERLRPGHARASPDDGWRWSRSTRGSTPSSPPAWARRRGWTDYRSVSFWQKPSLLTAWNVTGQPVLALPNGFGRGGLPLGMQIVGRPFDEATILRIGHAYEQATDWHTRRPPLVRGADGAGRHASAGALGRCRVGRRRDARSLREGARSAPGLQLDELGLTQLLEGAPYALGMVHRLAPRPRRAPRAGQRSDSGGPDMAPQTPRAPARSAPGDPGRSSTSPRRMDLRPSPAQQALIDRGAAAGARAICAAGGDARSRGYVSVRRLRRSCARRSCSVSASRRGTAGSAPATRPTVWWPSSWRRATRPPR